MSSDLRRMSRLFEEARGALITLADEARVKAEYRLMREIYEMADSLKLLERETFNTEE